jgi:hypothetical protein
MCTFHDDDRSAMVCDVAIGCVREAVARALGSPGGPGGPGARFIVCHGEGTLIELDEGLDPSRFRAAVEEGMRRAAG